MADAVGFAVEDGNALGFEDDAAGVAVDFSLIGTGVVALTEVVVGMAEDVCAVAGVGSVDSTAGMGVGGV